MKQPKLVSKRFWICFPFDMSHFFLSYFLERNKHQTVNWFVEEHALEKSKLNYSKSFRDSYHWNEIKTRQKKRIHFRKVFRVLVVPAFTYLRFHFSFFVSHSLQNLNHSLWGIITTNHHWSSPIHLPCFFDFIDSGSCRLIIRKLSRFQLFCVFFIKFSSWKDDCWASIWWSKRSISYWNACSYRRWWCHLPAGLGDYAS